MAISTIVQIFFYLGLSALADYGSYRKKALFVASNVGSVACCFLPLAYKSEYWLGGLILTIGAVGLGLGSLFYNSFLPFLAEGHAKLQPDYAGRPGRCASRCCPDGCCVEVKPEGARFEIVQQVTNKISGNGKRNRT